MKKLLVAASLLTACVAMANPYAKCAGCHGDNGEKAAMGASLVIKDMSKADFVGAMKGYQDGSYGKGKKFLMAAQARGLDDATLNAIADQLGLK